MARSGLANPILELRRMTNAGTADYSIAGVSYFTDDQLQTVLDKHREDVFSEALEAVPTVRGGTTYWYDYYCTPAVYEEGTATFQVTNSLGDAVTPTVNYQMGHLSFGTVNQGGTAYYLTARKYDIFRAAAEVLRSKAAYVAIAYDFSADGHSMSRSQMQKQYLQMADEYDAKSKPIIVQLHRGDEG